MKSYKQNETTLELFLIFFNNGKNASVYCIIIIFILTILYMYVHHYAKAGFIVALYRQVALGAVFSIMPCQCVFMVVIV